MHSYQITRYELRINLAENTVGLWLLLTNLKGENIYIAYQNLNEELSQLLGLRLSTQNNQAISKLRFLISSYEQKTLSFNELMAYNKYINQ